MERPPPGSLDSKAGGGASEAKPRGESTMVAQQTQDAVWRSERALAVLHGKWDGLFASIEIVRQHGGNTLPLLAESDRIAALVRAETTRHREASRRFAREVVATAEE